MTRSARRRRLLFGTGAVAAFLSVVLACQVRAVRLTRPVDPATVTTTEWRDDLHYLARELARRHANAFHRISRDTYWKLVARIDSTLPTLSGWDAAVNFERLTAAVGDAHSYITLPSDQHFYPIDVRYFVDVPRVVGVAPSFRGLLGARLAAIDGVSMDDVEARLRRILTRGENPWYYRADYPWFLSREVLHALWVVGDTEPTTFTFARADGSTLQVRMSSSESPGDSIRPYGTAPLYIPHAGDDFRYTALPDSSPDVRTALETVYVAFNSYRHLGGHVEALFRYLDEHAIRRLVIDLRNNGGGDYQVGHRDLIAPILARPWLDRLGALYVITGRFTFSAAMSNAAQFRTETSAILVGEPPGEVPDSYQERRSFRLPHSHLLVNYSVRYYHFLPTDVPALLPDTMIEPDWSAYRSGRDLVLEWILSRPVPTGEVDRRP